MAGGQPGLTVEDRFLGSLLGQAVGDGVGAPFEGMPGDLVLQQFGRASEIVAKPPVETLYYTDDTQMAVVLAEVLCEGGTAGDEEGLIQAFAAAYDPKRGYGPGARKLLEAVRFGEDWRAVAANVFPGGSYGNGGAMRAGPVGLFFHEDLDRVWEEAGKSAVVTHRHPLGVEGAQLLATAVAIAARGEAGDADRLWGGLYDRATLDEYQWLLRTASRLTARDGLGLLESGMAAHRSVVTSITCFAIAPDSYVTALGRALALGGDTDTLMAMTGAISGAHLGSAGVPGHLAGMLEEGEKGRTYIEGLAKRLAGTWRRRMGEGAA
jgi:poly(ADP-ribose) glycohydrolase ARH3